MEIQKEETAGRTGHHHGTVHRSLTGPLLPTTTLAVSRLPRGHSERGHLVQWSTLSKEPPRTGRHGVGWGCLGQSQLPLCSPAPGSEGFAHCRGVG